MRYKRKFLVPVLTLVLIVSMIPGNIKGLKTTAYAETNTAANSYGGTDYYIDATGGNDSDNGTSQLTAWKNLTKANATTFQPGDRILLKAGETWENQQLMPKGSGVEGQPITITSYGDIDTLGRPCIATNGKVDSPVTYTGGTYVKNMDKVGLTGAVVLQNQQYWEIYNLELSNDDNFNSDITNQTIVRDGINISIQADKLASAPDKIMNHFIIENCYIHDIDGPSYWQKIHYGGIIFQVFGSGQYTSYEDGAYYFQDVTIQNNSFVKTELHAIEFAFNWFGDSAGQYDESGKYHEGWEQLWVRTKDLYSRDVYIGHNYCENIGQGAIQLANTQNMTVEYNEVNGYLKRYNSVSCGLYLWAGADSVMQYNEVYDGPYNEYDGTPWDLEYTNFNVTYQYNYSHDNSAGWMAYMGNSSNSIARYNLSVDDNGVIVKNMLSTNYSPTYFVNNVFVYDASRMDYIHDYYFKDTVNFYNNIFYNYSATTPTKWYNNAYPNAFQKANFFNNVYYEAGGIASGQEPDDANKITADLQFIGDPVNNPEGLGVDNILTAACGEKDFFGTDLYYGDELDIGIHEAPIGVKVDNPVEKPLRFRN
ncbi:MAG: right-handed parallel beta-helix repeat-containing protein [Anaerocolumna sp.]